MPSSLTTTQVLAEITAKVTSGAAFPSADLRTVLNDMSVSYLNVYNIQGFAGIDITGATDSAAGLQAAINGVPDGSTILFPVGCTLKLNSMITVLSRTHLSLIGKPLGPNVVPGAAGGDSAAFVWNGPANGTMFLFKSCFNPYVCGFRFSSNVAVDRFLSFDFTGLSSVTGTAPHVFYNSFQTPGANANFVAVYISETSTTNMENAIVSWNSFNGFGSTSRYSVTGSVSTASSTVTISSGTSFSAGDVGKRIRITYATPAGHIATDALIDTTISSFTSASAVVLASGNAAFTQSNCTVHVGECFGTGIKVGNSQNSKHHKFDYNISQGCAVVVDVPNGSFSMNHLNGVFDDIGVRVGGGVVEPCEINFFESEHNMVGISIFGSSVPVMLRSCRMANDNQAGNGYFQLAGIVNMENCGGVSATPSTNQALVAISGASSFLRLNSKGGTYNCTPAQFGVLSISGYPAGASGMLSQNDKFDNGTQLAQLMLHSNNFFFLPPTPILGMLAIVEDSTTAMVGAPIAGSGGNRVLTWHNGVNWVVLAGDTGYQFATPTTGGTVTLTTNENRCIIDPAGTLAALTISMVAAPFDGQSVDIKISQIITALTVSGNGNSVKGNPTSAAAGSVITGIYRAANTTWYF